MFGVIIQIRHRNRGRCHCDKQNRRIRRIDFSIRRRNRHFDRQGPLRPQERGLHIKGGAINCPPLFEFERESRVTQGTGRANDAQTRDGLELLLEGQSDRAGHGLRACTGQRGRHTDGRRVVGRQCSNWNTAVGNDPSQHHRKIEQHGHHRSPNEEFRKIHGAAFLAAPPGVRSTTAPPGRRFCRPSRTSFSPALTPVTAASSPSTATTLTGRNATLPSSTT